jgi:hypothetical protein
MHLPPLCGSNAGAHWGARNIEDLMDDLAHEADVWHARASAAHRELFHVIVALDRTGSWAEEYGARDLAHWLSMR